jgi:hypothetical protein
MNLLLRKWSLNQRNESSCSANSVESSLARLPFLLLNNWFSCNIQHGRVRMGGIRTSTDGVSVLVRTEVCMNSTVSILRKCLFCRKKERSLPGRVVSGGRDSDQVWGGRSQSGLSSNSIFNRHTNIVSSRCVATRQNAKIIVRAWREMIVWPVILYSDSSQRCLA